MLLLFIIIFSNAVITTPDLMRGSPGQSLVKPTELGMRLEI